MFDLARRLRGFAIALVVLAMTAGVAFAASPNAGPRWNPAALDALFGGNEVNDAEDADESEAPESEAPESEAPDQSEVDESEAPESESPDADSADASHAPNHGDLVSTAAGMTTPDGFANHGAFVRCVAHMQGVDPTTFDWSTVTPAACADAWDHAPGSRGHHGHKHDS